jgi:hypothetical protein
MLFTVRRTVFDTGLMSAVTREVSASAGLVSDSCRMTPEHHISQLEQKQIPPLELAVQLLTAALERGDFRGSVSNCHVGGMDSIVLADHSANGQGMVRFYFARHGQHTLDRLTTDEGHFTVGIHNHKYRIAKIPLHGRFLNVRTAVSPVPTAMTMHEYAFSSALRSGSSGMGVSRRALRYMEPVRFDDIPVGSVAIMEPEDLHTVTIPVEAGSPGTAWMVIEGPAVPIEPLIYSPRADLTLSADGLYRPMSAGAAAAAVEDVLRLTRGAAR